MQSERPQPRVHRQPRKQHRRRPGHRVDDLDAGAREHDGEPFAARRGIDDDRQPAVVGRGAQHPDRAFGHRAVTVGEPLRLPRGTAARRADAGRHRDRDPGPVGECEQGGCRALARMRRAAASAGPNIVPVHDGKMIAAGSSPARERRVGPPPGRSPDQAGTVSAPSAARPTVVPAARRRSGSADATLIVAPIAGEKTPQPAAAAFQASDATRP